VLKVGAQYEKSLLIIRLNLWKMVENMITIVILLVAFAECWL
jgi:hypothetical protein